MWGGGRPAPAGVEESDQEGAARGVFATLVDRASQSEPMWDTHLERSSQFCETEL